MAFGDIRSPDLPCGKFILDEDKEYRKGYETASWYKTILVPAGEYEITTNGYWTFIRLPGIVQKAYFPSSFGGMQYGSGDRPEEVGTKDSYCRQCYAYDIAKLFEDDPEHYQMNEGWSINVTHFRSELFGGKIYVSRKMVPPQ